MKKLVLSLCLLVPAATVVLQAQDQGVPHEVVAWIESEVAKCDTPPVTDLHSPQEFFSNEKNARLVGYIKGYDPNGGFTAGKITHYNMITGENLVSIIEIQPDGRFTSDVRLASPAVPFTDVNNKILDLYLEPGQTLGVILDYEDFLKPVRYVRPVAYYGPLAVVNEEFNEHKIPSRTGGMANPSASALNKYILDCWKRHSDNLDKLIETNAVSPKSADILRSRIINVHAGELFGFFDQMKYNNQNDPYIDQKIDSIKHAGYYDFLQQTPLNDPALLIPYNSHVLVNRYEYADTYKNMNALNRFRNPKATRSFYEYLTEELKITDLSQEEADHFKRDIFDEAISRNISLGALYREYVENDKKYSPRFAQKAKDHREKYMPAPPSQLDVLKLELRLKDSMMKNMFRIQPNLVQDIAKIHCLKSYIERLSREEARGAVDYMQYGFTYPFMAVWAEKIYNEKFPSGGGADDAYEIPQGKAADIFKRIIDPFRGKLLIVDFWGTGCGPCVAEIISSKGRREAYKDDDRIAFIYITDMGWSPNQAAYDKMVAENFMPNSYRLPTDEWNYLSQLFQINAIPHQMLITPDGKVAEKRFRPDYNKPIMDALIGKYFPAK